MMSDLSLANEFPEISEQAWRALVQKSLGTTDFNEALVHETVDGFAIKPLYAKAANSGVIAGERGASPWDVIQRIDHPKPVDANKQALEDLENGARGLGITIAGSPFGRGFGVRVDTIDHLDQIFADIALDAISVRLEAGGASLGTAACMIALANKRNLDLEVLDLSLGLDPIGTFAMRGMFPPDYTRIGDRLGDIAAALHKNRFGGIITIADGRNWHNAGAGNAQELAAILGAGVTYLRDMERANVPLDWAARRIGAVVSADCDQLLTIAKVRALRILWAQVLGACDIIDQPLHIHAETSWRMMTRRDVHVNMLRTTLAVFSAGIGGADSICTLPFTSALGLPDKSARRLARNTQNILLEEAHLARVVDPAAGSGALEALTQELALGAWALFQEMERDGGIVAQIVQGKLQIAIAKSRQRLVERVGDKSDLITGVTAFPPTDDQPPSVLDVMPVETVLKADPIDLPQPGNGAQFEAMIDMARNGADAMGLTATRAARPLKLDPLIPIRLSQPFETSDIEGSGI